MENSNSKIKNIRLIYLVIMVFAVLLGNWLKTSLIAADAGYLDYLEQRSVQLGIVSIPNGFSLGSMHIYQPFAWKTWVADPMIQKNMPDIVNSYGICPLAAILLGAGVCYLLSRKNRRLDSHGTAEFASAKDIEQLGLTAKDNGVVCGRNPYTDKIMLHDGPEHIFLAAPTRSGKGVGIIIPTGIIWKHSIFFFDPKGELWASTAGFRQKNLKQKVLKFEPLCSDGSAAKWNPYAEINFQSYEEYSDVTTINETMVKTGEQTNSDPFWNDSAINVLNGVVMHLMYKNCQENRELPCPTDVFSFLSSPNLNTDQLFSIMKVYPHISPEEFMELEYEEEVGDGTEKKKVKKQYHNPLKEVYGTYYTDFAPIVDYLRSLKVNPLTDEEYSSIMEMEGKNPTEELQAAFENLRKAIVARKEVVSWKSPMIKIRNCKDIKEIEAVINTHKSPLYRLLVHAKVAESAANILEGAKETRQSILSSAKTPLALYQDPLIRKNTAVSDFCFRDLMNPEQAISLYMVLQPNDIDKLRPLTRLFVNTMIAKTVRDMKFDNPDAKKQRLLLMLDEFPQLKKMETIGNTLAICAGYGVKICIVVQNITQLNEIYTKDGSNKILSNSQVQIYMTPSEYDTAKVLSDTIGDKTITAQSQSSNGLFKGGSTSTSEQGRKLLNPDEIMRMDKDKNQLVLVQGGKPIMAKKIRWYKEPYFQKRAFAIHAPIFSDTCTAIRDYEQLFAIHAAEVADIKERQEKVNQARLSSEAETAGQDDSDTGEATDDKENAGEDDDKNTSADNQTIDNQSNTESGTLVEFKAPERSEVELVSTRKDDEQIERAEEAAESDIQQPAENIEPEKEKDYTAEPGNADNRPSQPADIPRTRPAGEEEVDMYDDEPANLDPVFLQLVATMAKEKEGGSDGHGTSA
ncbi:type IV secretory system conjugative DNA transfer family protein [Anaerovibrio sp.]|uniref:type IV secretory system conjugative DNA transfer family protein n=1 Tax=Anaerovibrio sp. TaxID=1872532 RepID=UPI003F142BBE